MDKKEAAGMIKKCCLVFLLLAFVALVSGCQTVTMGLTGATDGIQRDWESLKEIDSWMRENLW